MYVSAVPENSPFRYKMHASFFQQILNFTNRDPRITRFYRPPVAGGIYCNQDNVLECLGGETKWDKLQGSIYHTSLAGWAIKYEMHVSKTK